MGTSATTTLLDMVPNWNKFLDGAVDHIFWTSPLNGTIAQDHPISNRQVARVRRAVAGQARSWFIIHHATLVDHAEYAPHGFTSIGEAWAQLATGHGTEPAINVPTAMLTTLDIPFQLDDEGSAVLGPDVTLSRTDSLTDAA